MDDNWTCLVEPKYLQVGALSRAWVIFNLNVRLNGYVNRQHLWTSDSGIVIGPTTILLQKFSHKLYSRHYSIEIEFYSQR